MFRRELLQTAIASLFASITPVSAPPTTSVSDKLSAKHSAILADLALRSDNYVVGSGYATIYTPAYITGLESNTKYYFRLSAKNIFGTVNGETYSFTTNTTPVPSGTAPTTNTIAPTDITRTTVNLHGRINPNGSETTFWFSN